MLNDSERWRDELDQLGIRYVLTVTELPGDDDDVFLYGPDFASAAGLALELLCPNYVSARDQISFMATSDAGELQAAERRVNEIVRQLRQRDDLRFAFLWRARGGEQHMEYGGYQERRHVAESVLALLESEWAMLVESI